MIQLNNTNIYVRQIQIHIQKYTWKYNNIFKLQMKIQIHLKKQKQKYDIAQQH